MTRIHRTSVHILRALKLFTDQSCLTLAVVSPPLVPSDWQLTEITLAEFYLPSPAQRAQPGESWKAGLVVTPRTSVTSVSSVIS